MYVYICVCVCVCIKIAPANLLPQKYAIVVAARVAPRGVAVRVALGVLVLMELMLGAGPQQWRHQMHPQGVIATGE